MADIAAEVELASPPPGGAVAVPEGGHDDVDDLDAGGGVDLEATRHEVLEMNSYAMHLCQEKSFAEALDCLETALLRVQSLAEHVTGSSADEQSRHLLDQLKATTLNNLGVVGCHRGDYGASLEHLEAARNLESRAGIDSPSTALNLCAVYNAINDPERASAHAQEAIALLNADGQGLTDETKALWGAAWHNLGIAELNKNDKLNSHSKNADVLCTFRNAMAATKDLLGPKHPMTVAVHDTYRKIRQKLKAEGAFLERQPVITLPRIRNGKTLPRPPSPDHPARHALMGGLNNHGNGKYTAPPPVSRFVGLSAYKKPEPPQTARATASRGGAKFRGGDLFHPSEAMKAARRQYCTQHPLLPPKTALGGSRRGASRGASSALPAISERPANTAPTHGATTARRPQASLGDSIQQSQSAQPHHHHQPHPPHQAGGPSTTARQAPKRRLSELLLGDMWVEVQVPRHASPNAASGSAAASPHSLGSGGANATGGGNAGGGAMSPVRPGYGEALYVIDPADAALEPIAEPGSHAQLDSAPPPQQQQQQQAPQHSEPELEAPRQQSHEGAAAAELGEALGPSLGNYPGLEALVQAGA